MLNARSFADHCVLSREVNGKSPDQSPHFPRCIHRGMQLKQVSCNVENLELICEFEGCVWGSSICTIGLVHAR